MSHDHVDIDKHVRTYLIVFGVLVVMTVVTVAVSYLHLPVAPAVALALLIALFKGSLVANFFMHLKWEKKMIYWILLLTVIFFFFVLLIPSWSESGNIDLGTSG